MKRYIQHPMHVTAEALLLSSFLIGLTVPSIYAQIPTPEERQQIVANLDSSDYELRSTSLYSILLYRITEAIPSLERNIWKEQRPRTRHRYLQALSFLGAPSAHFIALAFMDSLGNPPKPEEGIIDRLDLRLETTETLFHIGDFSTTRYIFEYLNQHEGEIGLLQLTAVRLLESVVRNVPQFGDSARMKLFQYVSQGKHEDVRKSSLKQLVSLYASEVVDVVVKRADSDLDATTRLLALKCLYELQYLQIKDFLYARLREEPEWSYRTEIVDSLLMRFGAPEDYQVVKDYQALEPNPTAKSLIEFSLRDFKPPLPPASITPLAMLDTLISYRRQVQALGWILNEGIIASLDQKLDAVRKAIVNDRPSAKQILQAFVNELEALNQQGNQFKQEAYIFLRNYASYIIQRL